MSLDDIRKEIDDIDGQLIELIKRRMCCSRQVADFKKANGLAVFDPEREQQILNKVTSLGGKHGDALRAIYLVVLEESKALQRDITG